MKRSPLRRKSRLNRRKAVKRANAKRRETAFARQYHSVERVEFVKAQPCAACGRLWGSENAHVLGNDGAGRKGAYTTIAPLCGMWWDPSRNEARIGCHRMHDVAPAVFRAAFPDFNPEEAAAATERRWQHYLSSSD